MIALTESFEASLIDLKFSSEDFSPETLLFVIFANGFFIFFSGDQLGPFKLS